MKTIRGGKGLGDALYVQSVCRHLIGKGERLCVATSYPEVFSQIAVETMPFTRQGIDFLAHYSLRKPLPTRQWQDVCMQAGIAEPVDLRLDWKPTGDLGASMRRQANGRRIVAVQLPRTPMARKDGFGAELLPDCRRVQQAIDAARARGAFIVQIGSGKPLFEFDGIDVSFSGRTTVRELFDVALEVDAFVGYVSFVVPLAESLNKPALIVWSRRGLKAPSNYVRQITPAKIIEKPSTRAVMDDASDEYLTACVDAIL